MPHGNVKPLSEQVVVIFGGTSGIGRACAFEFFKQGAHLVLASRSRYGILKTCKEVDASAFNGTADEAQAAAMRAAKTDFQPDHTKLVYHSERILGIECDVVDSLDVKAVFEMTQHLMSFSKCIDTVVYSSAVFMFSRFEDSTIDEIQQITNVNYLGACRVAKECIPIMKRQYLHGSRVGGGGSRSDQAVVHDSGVQRYFGTLIMISSVEGKAGIVNQSAYAASKHAMEGFIQVLSQEFQADNVPIHLHSILPSAIDTPLYDKCRQKVRVVHQLSAEEAQASASNVSTDAAATSSSSSTLHRHRLRKYITSHPNEEVIVSRDVVGGNAVMASKIQKLGPPPLIYSPELVARTVVRAACSSSSSNAMVSWLVDSPRDLIVGTSGWLVVQIQKYADRVLDYMTAKLGDWLERLYVIQKPQTEAEIDAQRSSGETLTVEKVQEDNLFKPVEGKPELYENRGRWCSPNNVHDFSLYNYIREFKWLPM